MQGEAPGVPAPSAEWDVTSYHPSTERERERGQLLSLSLVNTGQWSLARAAHHLTPRDGDNRVTSSQSEARDGQS